MIMAMLFAQRTRIMFKAPDGKTYISEKAFNRKVKTYLAKLERKAKRKLERQAQGINCEFNEPCHHMKAQHISTRPQVCDQDMINVISWHEQLRRTRQSMLDATSQESMRNTFKQKGYKLA